MKVAILWTQLSGYLNCMMKALAAKPGVEIYVANEAAGKVAPYDASAFQWIPRRYEYPVVPDRERLLREVEAFAPDIILAAWHVKAYQQCCLRFKGRAVRVGCGDNQWTGNVRQRVASATSSLHLRKFYDAIFIPGERQAMWATHMGFNFFNTWNGMFAPDSESFWSAAAHRNPDEQAFVFAARLAKEKGLETLVEAYQGYASDLTEAGEKPWVCKVAGTGPLDHLLTHPGFLKLGFVQPAAMPQLFGASACFLLPSLYEPWGVVLQEAAASGLPIICTHECGASVHLVRDNYNGFIVDAGDSEQLKEAMTTMTRLSVQRRQEMSQASRGLSLQFTPELWATTVVEKGRRLQARLRSA